MFSRMIKTSVCAVALAFSGNILADGLPVVSSFSILGDVAQQIGGTRVSVTNLVGADQDAHAYQLTSGDVKKIAAAKVLLVNGLGLEKADIIRTAKQNRVFYAEAAQGITPLKGEEEHYEGHAHHHEGHEHHHDHGEFDPHVWNDPVLMQKYAANVADALSKADPAGSSYYQARLKSYQGQLQQLDAYARQQFNAIPLEKRKILTGHDAFNYLAKRYGITFLAPQGVSTESEPSAKTVAAIIRQIKQQGVKAVFTENIKDGRMVQRIAQETGAKVGGTLYSDALSKGAPAKTYVDMFRYNVRVMSGAMK